MQILSNLANNCCASISIGRPSRLLRINLNFKEYETFLDAAEKHHMKVLALLVYDNNAAETDP